MKTEEIIKILLILGVLYLLFNCKQSENFGGESVPVPDSEPAKGRLLVLKSNNEIFRLVRLTDLKDEFAKIFISSRSVCKKCTKLILNSPP